MTLVATEHTRSDGSTGDVEGRRPPRIRTRKEVLPVAFAAMMVLVAALYPSLRAGFWSWDWYWIDEHARGNTAWGGPFYDLGNHANPVPVEVQWYRATLSALGLNPFAHHLLALTGLLATVGVLYLLMRRLDIPRWAGAWAVVLAGLAPASLTSWTWFAASPHMWAALLGLGAAVTHLAWRQGGSRMRLALVAPALTVLGLAMKNDAVIGPLLILAWEWTSGRSPGGKGRAAVTAAAILPVAAFVWWQSTALDPHRDTAETGIWHVVSNAGGLLRFAFLWRGEAELRAEFPPAPAPPMVLIIAGAVVGAAVLALAAISLRSRAGRILVFAGLASLGPIAVLQPALLSRYVLPPVLMITAAAGAGAAHLARRRFKSRHHRAAMVAAAVAALAVWGTLAHLASGAGVVATREERALLSGLVRAGLTPRDEVAVRLVGSPVEPSTAGFRQTDPGLPPQQRLRGVIFLRPGQATPPGMPLATATRTPEGTYTVVIVR